MYRDRIPFYKKLENEFNGKVLAYITGDRSGFTTSIAGDVIDPFIDHLDTIGAVNTIILYLYTRGGDTAAAWNIVNLIRMYCEKLIVVIPHKAHSAGTIISLGANEIIMTKQATLSPIDPSLNTPLNPKINETATYPVSVEAVNGYIELAKKIEAETGFETRANVLGHMQRGGSPCPYDRVLSTRLGAAAAEAILDGDFGKMMGVKNGDIVRVPLAEVAGKLKYVDPDSDIIKEARMTGISFGDK